MKARMSFTTIDSDLVQRTVARHRADAFQSINASKSSTFTEN